MVTRLRSCARCGADFRTKRQTICANCRNVPKLVEKIALGTPLSPRERQVAKLVSEAKPDKQIAFELHLTTGTVKVYVSHILHKTGFGNRVQLAVRTALEAQASALHVPAA